MAQTNAAVDVDKILSTIREVESKNNYGAKSKGSSASGAYQFIDDTWQRYTQKSGIGTEYPSAALAPPEVQDRVARFKVEDVLSQVGGDVNKVPLVWYTGNPEGRMTESALKANRGMTPDKYQQKWLSVFNQGQAQPEPTKVSSGPRTTAQVPKGKQPAVQVASAITPTSLPSSYTSALALNYLVDTDPEGVTMSKVNEMLADMMEDGGGATKISGGRVLQQFAQSKSADPFQFVLQQTEEPKAKKQRVVPKMPRMFADGGLVAKAANLQTARLKAADKDWLAAREKEFEGYNAEVAKYNAALADYQKQVDVYNESIKPYQAEYDAYEKAVDEYNAKIDNYSKLLKSYVVDDRGNLVKIYGPGSVGGANYYIGNQYTGKHPLDTPMNDMSYMPVNLDESAWYSEYANRIFRNNQIPSQYEFVKTGTEPYYKANYDVGYLRFKGVTDPFSSFTQRTNPGEFTLKPPGNPPPAFGMTEPTVPQGLQYTPEQVQQYQTDAVARAQKAAQNRATALQVITGQGPYANLGLALSPTQPVSPRLFSEGGDVNNMVPEDEYRKQSMQMLYNLRGNVGPVTGQFVPAPDGVDVRASTQLGAIRPFVDLSPNEMAVSQVGAAYGNVGPQGGYELSVSKRAPMATPYGKIDMPVTAQGMYSAPIGKNGRVEAGAFYVPRQGQMPESAYGAQMRYSTRFADGGAVNTVPGPMSNEIPRVDAQGRVIREAPTPEPQFSLGERALGAGETALAALSGLTAPASIIYDMARGKTREEVSPGNFMYTPRTPAGQEMAQDLGRFMQEYKLDAALPQVQLMRPYPAAAAARQGIAAIERGAEKAGTSAVRAITGKPDITPEQIYGAMGDTKGIVSLGAPAAVKPGGGVVDAGGPESLIQGAAINRASEAYKKRTGQDVESWTALEASPEGQNIPAIEKWAKTKAREYFTKQYGSPRDPLLRLFQENKYTPVAIAKMENDDIPAIIASNVSFRSRLAEGRRLLTSNIPEEQTQGRILLSGVYDEATPVTMNLYPETVRNRLMNPQYRESIVQYLREELDLGPEDIGVMEMDSVLDSFAKTGKLSRNAPFFETDIANAVTANTLDKLAEQIETQGGIFGRGFGKQDSLNVADKTPPYLTTAEKENIARGEPTYTIGADALENLASRQDIVRYMLNTPKEKWENLSFPEVLLQVDKATAKSMDPADIAKRIDNYKSVNTEQRLVGTSVAFPLKESSLGKGATWREITDPGGIQIEGRLLKHCLSLDPKYESFLVNGQSKFFALRDKDGKSYATIQVDRLGQGGDGPFANIRQIKGFRNDYVGDQYAPEIMQFLENYEKKVGVPLRYTEGRSYLPPALRDKTEYIPEFAKGGMVDKPLYDRAA